MAVTARNGIKANWVGNGGWLLRGGKLVFDPRNDGDDDSHANTDKDHDYWTVGGQPTAYQKSHPIPPRPTAAQVAAARNGDDGDNDDGDDGDQTPAQQREAAFRKMASSRRRR
jgi:hypothetical protein